MYFVYILIKFASHVFTLRYAVVYLISVPSLLYQSSYPYFQSSMSVTGKDLVLNMYKTTSVSLNVVVDEISKPNVHLFLIIISFSPLLL